MITAIILLHLFAKVVYAPPPAANGEVSAALQDSGADFLEALFTSENEEIWTKDYLQSSISMRIVLKSWKPSGPSSYNSHNLKSYSWNKNVAYESMKESKPYDFVEKPLKDAQELLTEASGSQYDKRLPCILVIHPLSASADANFVQTTVTALAMRNLHLYYNILVVDMPKLNLNMFITVLNTALGKPPMYEPVAEAIGDFFIKAVQDKLMKPADIHLIGWSYSGQLVGYIGRFIQDQIDLPIGSIIALDPNGNDQNTHLENVNEDDAQVVHVYHSNSFPFGTLAREGTADFTFNNGIFQPECNDSPVPALCSHTHVVQRFWYVILYGPIIFTARECDNVMQFNSGACDHNPTAVMTYPIGDNPARGNYFLRTGTTRPYGLREEGSLSEPTKREQLQQVLQEQRMTGSSNLDIMVLGSGYF